MRQIYKSVQICALGLALAIPVMSAMADDDRIVYETEMDASVKAVWESFTTAEGLKLWMAPLVEIDLTIGGRMKANYNPLGEIGDATTIENTILAYDPQRMLSLKASRFPEGFPFEEAAKLTWSVFYFSEMPSGRTKITIVGLGYTDSEDSQKMRSFFATANKQALEKLANCLREKRFKDQEGNVDSN